MKQYFLFVFLIFSPFLAFSQYQLGMRTERHSGLYATSINPAALSFNPVRWEVSLFTADFFGNQNYGRVVRASVPDILRNPDLLVLLEDLASDPGSPTAERLPVDFYTKGRAFGVVQSRISGPGFAFRINQQHSFGLSASGRFLLSSYRIPNLLRYNNISQLDYGQTYAVAPVKMSTLAWGEIAAHYAYRNFDGDIMFSAGITPKFITGLQGAYTDVNARFNYTPVVSDTTDIGSANWGFGFTNDIAYATDPATVRPRVNGYGGGVDLGFSWAMPSDNADRPEDYLWRAGVSILDIGAVRLNKNAEAHQIAFSQLTTIAGNSLDSAANIGAAAAVQELSNVLLGDPNQSKTDDGFTLGLPTMLSAQFDYAFTPNIYVQGLVTQRLPVYRHSLKAPNTVAVVPRYEHRWFSVSVPVVVSDYRSLRLGLGARLGVFYIGSDDVLSWTGKRSLTGTDIYAGLKINGFKLRSGKKRQSNWGALRAKDRRWKDVGCFNQ